MAEAGTRKTRGTKEAAATPKAETYRNLRQKREDASRRAAGVGESVISSGPRQNQRAAKVAVARSTGTPVRLPFAGEVTVPSTGHLAYYAALGTLAAVEIIEWPLALVLGVGKLLADNHYNAALREFGKALDEEA